MNDLLRGDHTFAERIVAKWGTPLGPAPMPEDRHAPLIESVPETLAELWNTFGFSGFMNGLWWICDPVKWQPVVDVWIGDMSDQLPHDKWIAVVRTGFGSIKLLGRRTGLSLSIIPHRGWILPHDLSCLLPETITADAQLETLLLSSGSEEFDILGDNDEYLFIPTASRLGTLTADTMYGFPPAVTAGLPLLSAEAKLVNAFDYLQRLGRVVRRQLMPDMYRSLDINANAPEK